MSAICSTAPGASCPTSGTPAPRPSPRRSGWRPPCGTCATSAWTPSATTTGGSRPKRWRGWLSCPEGPQGRTSIISFNIDGLPPDQVGRILNEQYRIGVRTGHHCAVNYFIENDPQGRSAGNVRASFYLYNTEDEVDRFNDALRSITAVLAG